MSAATITYNALDGTPLLPDINDFIDGHDAAIAEVINTTANTPELFITTTDSPANHITGAGLGFDGVAELSILLDNNSVVGCTGSLLPDGQHILTAAHCFTTGGLAVAANAIFDLAGGPQVVSATSITLHPTWNGDFLGTTDLAVVGLTTTAPAAADRYDINRATNEVGSIINKVGYGLSGTGLTGSTLASGTKRDGQNTFDALGNALDGVIYQPGSVLPGGHLVFDFDSGLAANDASGFFLGANNLGLGNAEVSTAQGDSGGPAFINGRIAGVTSFGQGFNGLTDVLSGTNSSFGEFAVDTRVSAYAIFIDTLIDEVGAPTITDVTLSGSSWTGGVEYAFSDLVATGEQLRPIFTEDVNTLEIEFSEHVLLDGTELELRHTLQQPTGSVINTTVSSTGFNYDVNTHTATWDFPDLGDGKYAIHLTTDVTDVGGNALDGEWSDDPGANAMGHPTYDDYTDDPNRTFTVGNGTAGSTDSDGDGNQEFRLHFALLAGDYDGNGVVEATETVTGDGDGNGTTGDIDDINLRNTQAASNAKLPLLSSGADFFDDEIVDAADLEVWQAGFGTEFNGAGFLAWQRAFGSRSVWYAGSPTLAALTVGLPPQVLNVIISGSSSVHDPFSFDTVDGSGNQLVSVPVGAADTVSIVFSEGVNVLEQNLLVVGLRTASLPSIAEFSYDTTTNTATWQFDSLALGDQYVLSLSDTITDVEGNRLDGEWTNPASITTVNSAVSTFPSGDGQSGGRFNFVMTLLPDINGDNLVNYNEYYSTYYRWYYGSVPTDFESSDFNGDGVIDEVDFQLVLDNMWVDLQDLSILADFDGDYDVDAFDLDWIGDNIGLTNATLADGDLNGDGLVTIDDLDIAYAQFGLGISAVA